MVILYHLAVVGIAAESLIYIMIYTHTRDKCPTYGVNMEQICGI